MSTRKGKCPRCHKQRQMSSHHCLPRCHFNGNGERQDLCRSCHSDFEKILELYEGKTKQNKRRKLPMYIYRELIALFLKAGAN